MPIILANDKYVNAFLYLFFVAISALIISMTANSWNDVARGIINDRAIRESENSSRNSSKESEEDEITRKIRSELAFKLAISLTIVLLISVLVFSYYSMQRK